MGIFGKIRANRKKNYWWFHRFLEKWGFFRLWQKCQICQKCGKYVFFPKFKISQREFSRVQKMSRWSVLAFLKEFNRPQSNFFEIIPLLRSMKPPYFDWKCPKIAKMLKMKKMWQKSEILKTEIFYIWVFWRFQLLIVSCFGLFEGVQFLLKLFFQNPPKELFLKVKNLAQNCQNAGKCHDTLINMGRK